MIDGLRQGGCYQGLPATSPYGNAIIGIVMRATSQGRSILGSVGLGTSRLIQKVDGLTYVISFVVFENGVGAVDGHNQ